MKTKEYSSNALNQEVLTDIYKKICLYSGILFIVIAIEKFYLENPVYEILTYSIIGLSYFIINIVFSRNKTRVDKAGRFSLHIIYIAAICFDFIINGGIYSPGIFVLFPVVIIINFLLEIQYRKTIIAFIFIVYTSLVGVEYFISEYIESVSPLHPIQNIERSISLVVSLIFTSALITHILKGYAISKEKAIESEKVKSEFLEIMSHMIRTPLNSINGLGNLLLEDDITKEEKKDFVNRMINNAETLDYLIRDLSDLSIIQDKSLKLSFTNFNIGDLFMEINYKVSYLLERNTNDIEFNFEIPENIRSISLHADYQRIIQVLIHIIQNGINFTKSGSVSLNVNISENERIIVFSVLDTGIGMTKEVQSKLFTLINKQNAGFNVQEKGTGLGLNIAKGILEYMNGSIDITSEFGAGTQVDIKLPINLIAK